MNTRDPEEGADLFVENDGNGNLVRSPVKLFNNDFDQSPQGIFITLPFLIDPSNLDNQDPLFVDPSAGDYHVQTDSAVIDQGDNEAPGLPLTDKDGNPRVVHGVVDLGAFEFHEPGAVADLSLTQTDTPDEVSIGGALTYTLVVTNDGPKAATAVLLTDPLPAEVGFRSATATQGGCTEAAGTVTCALGTLATGASATVTIVVTPTAGGTSLNTASVTATETDPNSLNNMSTATTEVTPGVESVSIRRMTFSHPLLFIAATSSAAPEPALSVTILADRECADGAPMRRRGSRYVFRTTTWSNLEGKMACVNSNLGGSICLPIK
jgi:uncharacterized repeat protein (TIGR01451 family)